MDVSLWVNHNQTELIDLFKKAFPSGDIIHQAGDNPCLCLGLSRNWGYATVLNLVKRYVPTTAK